VCANVLDLICALTQLFTSPNIAQHMMKGSSEEMLQQGQLLSDAVAIAVALTRHSIGR
jgi:hypothetical protein